MLPLLRKHLFRITIGLLALVAALALVKLAARVYFESLGSYYQDMSMYLAVSRGILNGLTPYKDLFETKPPIIFLLGAASLKHFGDGRLLLWCCAALIGLLPIFVVAPVINVGEKKHKWLRILVALIFGIFLALYTADKSGQGIVESFGAFFGTVVVALAFLYRDKFPWWVIAVTTLCTAFAVGLKEPFILSILAGALIVSPSWKSMRRIALPVALAAILGVVGLMLFGWFGPYVSIYFAHMLGHQIAAPWGVAYEPLWLRTIDLPREWMAMQSFSFALPWLITALWILALLALLSHARTKNGRRSKFFQWLLATWLITLSVGIAGDFYGHQFIFAIPGYVAFFFVWVREWDALLRAPVGLWITRVWVALLCLGLLLTPTGPFAVSADWPAWVHERQETARVLDTVLDRCKWDRYLLLINANDSIQAYTTHSPYGPLFSQYARFVSGRPIFFTSYAKQFKEAPVAIYRDEEKIPYVDPKSIDIFNDTLTENPPPCAGKDFVQPSPYHIVFRKPRSA